MSEVSRSFCFQGSGCNTLILLPWSTSLSLGCFFIIVEENNIHGGKKIRKVYARHIKMRCSCFANCFFSCLLIDNGVFDIEPQKNRKKMLPALANLLKEIISSFQFVSIPLINPSFLPSLTLPSCYLHFVMFHPRQG